LKLRPGADLVDVAAERLNGARPRQARAVTDRRSFVEAPLSATSVLLYTCRASFAAAGPNMKSARARALLEAVMQRQRA
jgi:3-hydroxyisobutyrate dehydrogenase-like beta-hydroxyacid dehydrogenase